jgi:hypothetical protein
MSNEALIVTRELIFSILQKEIPLLFSEKAHNEYDFENMVLEFYDEEKEEMFDIDDYQILIHRKE